MRYERLLAAYDNVQCQYELETKFLQQRDEVSAEEIEKTREEIPELPAELRKRFTEKYAIPTYDASVLTSTKQMAGAQ